MRITNKINIMSHSQRLEDYIQTLTTFEFKVFNGSTIKDYLYDSTPEQCCNYVWKNYYSSAHFIKMTEFGIAAGYVKHIDSVYLKSIVNKNENGLKDETISEYSLRIRTQTEEFKKKHNLE